jgi:hypothetical protein
MAVVSQYREQTSVGSTKTVEGSSAAYRQRRDTIGPLKCSTGGGVVGSYDAFVVPKIDGESDD